MMTINHGGDDHEKMLLWLVIIMMMLMISTGLISLRHMPLPTSLKKLKVSYCGIMSLPENLFHFQLEEIDMSGNSCKE